MQMLFFLMIIVPIIIVGELHINKKLKKIILLILSFLYNTLLGLAMFIIAFSTAFLNMFNLSIVIVGTLFFIFLLPINIYVKRKVDINIIVYIMLSIIGFLIGLCLLWRG